MKVKDSEGGARWEEPEEEENRAGSSDVTARGVPREITPLLAL